MWRAIFDIILLQKDFERIVVMMKKVSSVVKSP